MDIATRSVFGSRSLNRQNEGPNYGDLDRRWRKTKNPCRKQKQVMMHVTHAPLPRQTKKGDDACSQRVPWWRMVKGASVDGTKACKDAREARGQKRGYMCDRPSSQDAD